MACAGVVGAFDALAKVDRVELEQQLAHWEITLAAHEAVRCVRRLGAFIAVELEDANAVQRAVHAGLKRDQGRGVLLFWFLSVPNAFRLAPPLTCTEEEMATGLTLILDALDQAL